MSADKPVTVSLVCKPGSSKPGVSVVDGILHLRVRERALEGAANDACIRALSEMLGIPRSSIELTAGARSRHKRFRISGIAEDEARARLAAGSG